MSEIYTVIVVILGILAISGLFVGVTNDAVNFLNSAIGSKAASMRVILTVASVGIIVGVVTSSGMMEVARSGMFNPGLFTFHEVMMLYLGVMFANIILLDLYNSWGLPTSTTVSLIFCLLGSAIAVSIYKISNDPALGVGSLGHFITTSRAMGIVSAILLSVVIAFTCGTIVMYISRTIFSFRYTVIFRRFGSLWCGASLTAIIYFAVFKGLKSLLADNAFVGMVDRHLLLSLFICWVACSVLLFFIQRFKINILRITILSGTFALALAFAGNDLVNFIGVPVAGFDAFSIAKHSGDPQMMMGALSENVPANFLILLAAGAMMILTLWTSKKAMHVSETELSLSAAQEDEGPEQYGSSVMSRTIVRAALNINAGIERIIPARVRAAVSHRFEYEDIEHSGAPYDMIRATVNLTTSAMLIAIATSLKLPLSTTYVCFMVAMGSSLADRAWGRETAVYRITGVITVIGGWFITAGAAFIVSFLIATLNHFGGFVAMLLVMCLVAFVIINNNRKFKQKREQDNVDTLFRQLVRSHDKAETWDLLIQHVRRTQGDVLTFTRDTFRNITQGLMHENMKQLRTAAHAIEDEKGIWKRYRRKEIVGMRKIDYLLAVEKNTWFHLGCNSSTQLIYGLKRMLEPCIEHVDNNFKPLPQDYIDELIPLCNDVDKFIEEARRMITTGDFDGADELLVEGNAIKSRISQIRHSQQDRIQREDSNIKVALLYLSTLQETQELMSISRHLLRASKRFQVQ